MFRDRRWTPRDRRFANFNQAMYSGFQKVMEGSRSPDEQAAALQDAWAEAKEAGNIPSQDL